MYFNFGALLIPVLDNFSVIALKFLKTTTKFFFSQNNFQQKKNHRAKSG